MKTQNKDSQNDVEERRTGGKGRNYMICINEIIYNFKQTSLEFNQIKDKLYWPKVHHSLPGD